MVIYHAINYSAFREIAFEFLAFLPPSFILITGFLVGQVYASKYDLRTWKPYIRLAIRGTKLFILFAFLNLAHCVFIKHGVFEGIDEFAARSTAIFLSGNGRAGIFEVLLPIAYFLLLAPALVWFRLRARGAIAACALVVFLLCEGLEMNAESFKNLNLLGIGIIGMALGLIPIQKIDRLATNWMVMLSVMVTYFFVSLFAAYTYPGQTVAGASAVLVLYFCALRLDLSGRHGRELVLLGKYSLLGYLAQIAVLQAIVKISGGKPGHVGGVIALALLATLVTFLIVRIVHASRKRSHLSDLIYRTVFA